MHLIIQSAVQTTNINLHPNEYSQEFHHYQFAVKLDRCVGSCNILNDLSHNVCAPNKRADFSLSVFNMVNESKTLTNHISCEWNVDLMKENVTQINSRIMINVDVNVKNAMYVKKNM